MQKPAVVTALLVAVSISGLFAERQRPRVEPYDPAKHHQDVTLRVTVDEPATFLLPASNSPVRLDLSALAIGFTTAEQPNPIMRSATLFHNSLTDSIFLTDGNNPAVALGAGGISFTNDPGKVGVRMTVSMALSSKGASKQLEISTQDSASGVTAIEVRIALWY